MCARIEKYGVGVPGRRGLSRIIIVGGRGAPCPQTKQVTQTSAAMNPDPESITAVTLVLETGEEFKEVPVSHTALPLAEFLDQALKSLEVSQKSMGRSVSFMSRVSQPS